MAIEKSTKEKYLNSLTQNYMDMLFYFSLKKTGNSFEAENLAQDILLNIITSLERGNAPENFEAWVWGVARNRYSVWAKKKHNRNELFVNSDMIDYEIFDDTANTENKVINSEYLNLLRRELAFISSEYRNVVVAYYIEDRKIKDIAFSLNLPEGTVKAKLFRARKILKEGLNMARMFGKRSYKPEDVTFMASGDQTSGGPWKVVQRRIPKNILLEADNNPLTIEQLAVELGIAMPYMEEEVKLLLDATLLKRIDDNYVTNIFIASKECQTEVWEVQRERSKERSEMVETIVSDSLDLLRDLGVVKNKMSDNHLKWWAVLFAMDLFIEKYGSCVPGTRDNGEVWGLMGFESCEIPEKFFVGKNGNGDDHGMFWAYKIGNYNLWDRVGEMGFLHAQFLADLLRNRRNISQISESEQMLWKEIEGRFACSDQEGNVIPGVVVLEENNKQKCEEIFFSHPFAEKLTEELEEVYMRMIAILQKYSHLVLEKQLAYCASMLMYDIRMLTVQDEIMEGNLIVPENPKESTIAMWIEYK